MRYSLLDRANTVEGSTDAEAVRAVVGRAEHAEELGYHRFLVAEHHAVPGIAGSAPGILAAAVGQATDTIRIGTAGIMVPDHAPIDVAEQAAVLESLFPGRVDIGLGSSPGFTPAVRQALRQPEDAGEARADFVADLREVVRYLRGETPVTLRPTVDNPPSLFLLTGGSPRSLETARELGLGIILGGPGPAYVEGSVVSCQIAVAESREEARDLVLPEVWAQVLSRSTGQFMPLQPVEALDEAELTDQQWRRIARGLEATIYGGPDEVTAAVTALVERTGATEILVTGGSSDPDGQARSDGMLAEILSAVGG